MTLTHNPSVTSQHPTTSLSHTKSSWSQSVVVPASVSQPFLRRPGYIICHSTFSSSKIKMLLRLTLAFCILVHHDALGMQCARKLASSDAGWAINKAEDILINCPRLLIDDDANSFCCYSDDYKHFDCCDFSAFMFSPLVWYWIGVAFAILILVLCVYCIIKFFGLLLDMCCGIVNYLHRKL